MSLAGVYVCSGAGAAACLSLEMTRYGAQSGGGCGCAGAFVMTSSLRISHDRFPSALGDGLERSPSKARCGSGPRSRMNQSRQKTSYAMNIYLRIGYFATRIRRENGNRYRTNDSREKYRQQFIYFDNIICKTQYQCQVWVPPATTAYLHEFWIRYTVEISEQMEAEHSNSPS